ncbi:LOW QUALITY PROTEIN: hypothetical protein NC652_029109 [Populus alba x Populus x berolinensis]|nr:LOW QUALITY PROTEIN: hypothetical protein NC652_029109 [Populus alba x Populus x berolinensis]
MKDCKGKKIVVFLDYDGTLSPIVNDPDLASCLMRKPWMEHYGHQPRLLGLVMGKYHAVSLDRKILKELEEAIMKIQGARVENNRFCVSVHFRQVRDEDYGILEEKVKSILKHHPDFRLDWGYGNTTINRMGQRQRPRIIARYSRANCTDVLPVYIGDDRTDEDAFKVIQKRGQGYPIVVASSPKDTKASYSLHDSSEVLTFLLRLARWRKASSSSSIICSRLVNDCIFTHPDCFPVVWASSSLSKILTQIVSKPSSLSHHINVEKSFKLF